MSESVTRTRQPEPAARVALAPLADTSTFAERAYVALKDVILSIDVYGGPGDVRLDERALAQDLGISRTPVREAMAQLEREGFVRSVPRRGIYVVRKTKQEVIELITAWAALEGMAARLITQHASDQEIGQLRQMFTKFENGQLHARLDEYSQVNIEFHQSIIRMSENRVLIDLAAESVCAHAHDPAQDHRRRGSRRPLDPRSYEHHPGAGTTRNRACRGIGPRSRARTGGSCEAPRELSRLKAGRVC